MSEVKDACVQPARGPIPVPEAGVSMPTQLQKEVYKMTARIGKLAPDFEASAFVDGGFKNIKLSDFKGRWIALCFYPGDFTFV
jgi:peroxiredoxin (alkyl hydroperoxide reductase subunit C)